MGDKETGRYFHVRVKSGRGGASSSKVYRTGLLQALLLLFKPFRYAMKYCGIPIVLGLLLGESIKSNYGLSIRNSVSICQVTIAADVK